MAQHPLRDSAALEQACPLRSHCRDHESRLLRVRGDSDARPWLVFAIFSVLPRIVLELIALSSRRCCGAAVGHKAGMARQKFRSFFGRLLELERLRTVGGNQEAGEPARHGVVS